jgi:hypothetical protein
MVTTPGVAARNGKEAGRQSVPSHHANGRKPNRVFLSGRLCAPVLPYPATPQATTGVKPEPSKPLEREWWPHRGSFLEAPAPTHAQAFARERDVSRENR